MCESFNLFVYNADGTMNWDFLQKYVLFFYAHVVCTNCLMNGGLCLEGSRTTINMEQRRFTKRLVLQIGWVGDLAVEKLYVMGVKKLAAILRV